MFFILLIVEPSCPDKHNNNEIQSFWIFCQLSFILIFLPSSTNLKIVVLHTFTFCYYEGMFVKIVGKTYSI